MRKTIIEDRQEGSHEEQDWLDLTDLADIELTSEDPSHPIESALHPGEGSGWRAGVPGRQRLRFIFLEPRRITQIRLVFEEAEVERTQEYILRWSKGVGHVYNDIVHQQWNFSPRGSHFERETHHVELNDVKLLELIITPDIRGPSAVATLKRFLVL